MVFTGNYEHTIDSKQRLAIPAEIRTLLQRELGGESGPLSFYVTLGEAQALQIYTKADFDQRAKELIESDADPDQLLPYETVFFALAQYVEMDSAGRIRLPERLIARAKLGKEIVITGANDHMDVRDRKDWNTYVDQVLADRPQFLVNPRRAIRRLRSTGGA